MYSVYPTHSPAENVDLAKTKTEQLKIPYKDGYVILNSFKEDDDERYWGTINHYEYMVYKGLDKYIYVNGEFYQVKGKWENEKYLLPEKDALKLFDIQGKDGVYSVNSTSKLICKDVDKDEVLKRLSNPNIPIDNAMVTTLPGQMPGADRAYRNGKHEGFDWYAGAIGIEISRQTKIHPIFEGRIVRIDNSFTELEVNHRERLLQEAAESNNTSQSTLDKLRGRQVWVQSANGILIHYAHTSSVNPKLKVGDIVKTTDWIATVGNSGTSNGALETNDDLHLHSDILVCGKNFWEYGVQSDMNNALVKIFNQKADEIKQEKETTDQKLASIETKVN